MRERESAMQMALSPEVAIACCLCCCLCLHPELEVRLGFSGLDSI